MSWSLLKGVTSLPGSPLGPAVPSTAVAFPLCTAIEILCRRYSQLRGSPVDQWRSRPRSHKRSSAASPRIPEVSTMNGTKWWLESRWEYLAFFNCSAWAATTPTSLTADESCEGVWAHDIPYEHLSAFPGQNETPIMVLSVRPVKPRRFQS